MISPNGEETKFSSIEEASRSSGLTLGSIKSRLNNGTGKKSKDGFTFRWADPSIIKKKLGKKNKRKGNAFEREICQKLKNAGYDVATTRSTDRSLDAQKCDIYSIDGKLPIIIQCKYTKSTPNFFQIKKECTIDNKPFSIFWKKAESDGKISPGTVVMIDIDFFINMLKIYYESVNNK